MPVQKLLLTETNYGAPYFIDIRWLGDQCFANVWILGVLSSPYICQCKQYINEINIVLQLLNFYSELWYNVLRRINAYVDLRQASM